MILHRRLSEVDGVLRFGCSWMILKNTKKPEDLRKKRIKHHSRNQDEKGKISYEKIRCLIKRNKYKRKKQDIHV